MPAGGAAVGVLAGAEDAAPVDAARPGRGGDRREFLPGLHAPHRYGVPVSALGKGAGWIGGAPRGDLPRPLPHGVGRLRTGAAAAGEGIAAEARIARAVALDEEILKAPGALLRELFADRLEPEILLPDALRLPPHLGVVRIAGVAPLGERVPGAADIPPPVREKDLIDRKMRLRRLMHVKFRHSDHLRFAI